MRQKFSDVIKLHIDAYFKNTHTAIPAKIESYNASTKKAEVKPLIKRKLTTGFVEYPKISNVPVIFPGSKSAVFHFPLNKGDGVLLIISEVAIENYLNSNGTSIVDPGDEREFSISDAIAIPGLFPFTNPGKTNTEDALVIEITGKNININGQNINLNGSSKAFVTHAELDAALQTFITALNLHVHSGVTTGPGASGPPLVGMSLNISGSATTTIKTGG